MFSLTFTAALFVLTFLKTVHATPCLAFDANFNLFVFGFSGNDYNVGAQETWGTSQNAAMVTKSGRPPFDGSSTTCYLSQFTNAIYVLDGDKANPSSVYIYDVAASSWSTQTVTAGGFDPASYNAILDHDTNVFYALSHGELYFLDMKQMKAATSSAIPWTDVGKAPYPSGYEPVMALAQNHIYFFNVPGVAAGSADIFVIHFSFFQPLAQAYPASGGGSSFPSAHGQAVSFFQEAGVQEEIAFIPDDGSATYIVNVQKNTTHTIPGPAIKDAKSIYFGSTTALVQLTSSGNVSYIPFTPNATASATSPGWSPIQRLASIKPSPATASSPSSTSTAGSSSSPGSSKGGSKSGAATDKAIAVVLTATLSIAVASLMLL